jgi:hypothetical protein
MLKVEKLELSVSIVTFILALKLKKTNILVKSSGNLYLYFHLYHPCNYAEIFLMLVLHISFLKFLSLINYDFKYHKKYQH